MVFSAFVQNNGTFPLVRSVRAGHPGKQDYPPKAGQLAGMHIEQSGQPDISA